jgi:hypothetical protein
MQEMVMWAAYGFGVFCAALAMETLKALIWVGTFFAFYRRLLRNHDR